MMSRQNVRKIARKFFVLAALAAMLFTISFYNKRTTAAKVEDCEELCIQGYDYCISAGYSESVCFSRMMKCIQSCPD
jgi:hypothetical protein